METPMEILYQRRTMSYEKNKKCETNPISKTPKLNINNYMTKGYNDNLGLPETKKRTQTNPILKGSQLRDKYNLKIHLFRINCPIVERELF
jgi:hypothetical protein